MLSAKGAAFNGQPGAAPQGLMAPTANRGALKARFTIRVLRRHGVISTSGMFWCCKTIRPIEARFQRLVIACSDSWGDAPGLA